MKDFMLIYKGGDPDFYELPPEEMGPIMEKWGEWMMELEKKGQLASGGSPLHLSGSRISKDHVVTDIAAAELKELVSGYSIIRANSLEEAVEISKNCPIFLSPIDYVEVREVAQID